MSRTASGNRRRKVKTHRVRAIALPGGEWRAAPHWRLAWNYTPRLALRRQEKTNVGRQRSVASSARRFRGRTDLFAVRACPAARTRRVINPRLVTRPTDHRLTAARDWRTGCAPLARPP